MARGETPPPAATPGAVKVEAPAPIPLDKETEVFFESLTPEVRQAFSKSLEILVEKKRRLWTIQMQHDVQETNKALGMEESAGAEIDKAWHAAIEQSLEGWQASAAHRIRSFLPSKPAEQLALLARSTVLFRWTEGSGNDTKAINPLESPAWLKALRGIMTPGQAQVWASLQTKRREEGDKELQDGLKRMESPLRDAADKQMAVRIEEIQAAVQLDPERLRQMQEMSKAAVDKYMLAWRRSAEAWLRQMEPAQRHSYLNSNGTFSISQADEQPENQPEWKVKLAALLKPEERQLLGQAKTGHLTRRVRALADVLLLQMDEEAALTKAQREQLAPLAEKLIRAHSRLGKDEVDKQEYLDYEEGIFLEAGAKATNEELKTALEPLQIKHWRDAHTAMLERQEAQQGRAPAVAGAPSPSPEEADLDAEGAERVLSDYLYQRSSEQRSRFLKPLLLQAEDLTRIGHLPEATSQHLQTAARGAAEAVLNNWRRQEEGGVRSQVSGAGPRELKQRLANLGEYIHSQLSSSAAANERRWKSALEGEITPEQLSTWDAEKKERQTFRENAITGLVLAETDRRVTLTALQWEKLRVPVAKLLGEIEQALPSLGLQDRESWYLQSYMLLMPLAGIPDAELKEILTKQQKESLISSNEYTNAASYWQNIMANRPARKKP